VLLPHLFIIKKATMNHQTGCLRHLTPQQLKQPSLALEAFTKAFELSACEAQLWHFTKAFLCSEANSALTAQQRSESIVFYEKLSAVIEAVFLMHRHPAPVVFLQPSPAA
jgi:hypothetical protein